MSDFENARRAKILSLFQPTGLGLEVGPSYAPFLPKKDGFNVETVDYADAEKLRAKYPEKASIIEDVDYVSDGRSLVDLIGQTQRYDFIYASHVIEHVTDFITFISDCENLLKPGGALVLVVPDKRFCFDAFRPVSTVGDILQSRLDRRERHPPGLVYDFIATYAQRNGSGIWSETNLEGVSLTNSPMSAHETFLEMSKSTQYVDVHAWRFTPASFRYAVKTLRALGCFRSGIAAIEENPNGSPYKFEFYIKLTKTAPLDEESDIALLKATFSDLEQITVAANSAPQLQQEVADLSAKNEILRAAISKSNEEKQAFEKEAAHLSRLVSDMRQSTSWRITSPVRKIKNFYFSFLGIRQ
ncbi:class I SAM-dependent methyltransferase [Endobacterium cereale]|uniref:class I SAM-dependent methyltransferase n=1 Tax=Endobacterium cereale TaxID=2663029 RepID=UPI002B47BCE6|nr:methyltransferase domain-containing protein [Endobacterium cereale]MEB2845941.1 methyltransferase domain-containing protein [Endobacterium cereale]